jgi:tetratricopeptide (TPR) repeat protein
MRLKTLCAWVLVVVYGAVLVACGTKILVPTFDTARDQLIFARAQKQNQIFSTDPKKRKQQMRSLVGAFEEVIKRFPDDTEYTPAAYIGMGEAYYMFHDYKNAEKAYSIALRKYPDQDDIQLFALYGLGLAHERLHNYAKALASYKEVIDRFGHDEREQVKEVVRQCEILYSHIRTE